MKKPVKTPKKKANPLHVKVIKLKTKTKTKTPKKKANPLHVKKVKVIKLKTKTKTKTPKKSRKMENMGNMGNQNINKININLGNLPAKLGILGNAVGNFDKVKKATNTTNRTFGSQTRYSAPQVHYGAPHIRYVQAMPNMATVSIPRSDLAGTGVSDIKGISNDQDFYKQSTNPADLVPVKKPSRMANPVPDNLKIYSPSRIAHPKVNADPRFSQSLGSKADLMRPIPATLAPTPRIPTLSSSSVGTFAQIGANPHAQAEGKFEELDSSDAYANPQQLDDNPLENAPYRGRHNRNIPGGTPSQPYGPPRRQRLRQSREEKKEQELSIARQSAEAQLLKSYVGHQPAPIPGLKRAGLDTESETESMVRTRAKPGQIR